jgi:hypothetical protein
MEEIWIYRPSKNTMQSGYARTQEWILEYEPIPPRDLEPLMGWASSRDVLSQVQLRFPSKEEAVAFAKRKGLPYFVSTDHKRRIQPRNYADKFKPKPS